MVLRGVRKGNLPILPDKTNPILATIELVFAAVLSVLAITVPLIAVIVVIVAFIFALLRIKKFSSQQQLEANKTN
jgi:hypothetical protein